MGSNLRMRSNLPAATNGIGRVGGTALQGLVCLLASIGPASGKAPYRLPDSVQPTFQSIELRLDPELADYTGSVRIELEIVEPVDAFTVHAEAMTIRTLALEGPDGDVPCRWELGDRELRIHGQTTLGAGAYVLRIDFQDDFNTNAVGLYRVDFEEESYAFTQFEADDAREAFPCFDEPEFKIPFQLTLEVPAAAVAVTNTPVESETTFEDWKRIAFARTKPLPTYLLAIAVGPLDHMEMDGLGVPGRIYTPKGKSALARTTAEMTPPILHALERWFDHPYPYEKLDFVAVPEFWPGAMEHPGAVTYADRIILIDPERISQNQRRLIAGIVGHELAHQWFGNLVTLEWWDDLWLNEAFADWMGDKIAHQVFPEFQGDLQSIRGTQRVMRRDARATARPVRAEVRSTDNILQSVGIAYNKGKGVLRMCESWIGEEAFRTGVLRYMEENAWDNASAEDLWRALAHASDSRLPEVMSSFVLQPGFPLLRIEPLSAGRIRVAAERYENHGKRLEPASWKVPVLLKLGFQDGARAHSFLLDTAETPDTVDLGSGEAPSWIYPNAGAACYYRWYMEADALAELAAHASSRLDAAERIDFLGNLEALFDAGVLTGGEYLASLEEFGADPEPQVLAALLTALENVRDDFAGGVLREPFAAYVRRTLRPAVERFGVLPDEDESAAVAVIRPNLLEWLAQHGRDPVVAGTLLSIGRDVLTSDAAPPPGLETVSIQVLAAAGGAEEFEMLRERFESASRPAERSRYLSALGHFESPDLRDHALDYALTGPLHANEIFTIPRAISASGEAGKDRVLDWFLEHHEAIVPRIPPIQHGGLPRLGGGCSAERLERAVAFFSDPENTLPGTEPTLSRVAEQVEDCLARNARAGDSVAAYLRATADAPAGQSSGSP